MATEKLIQDSLTDAGMTCLHREVDSDGIIKHYGYMKYSAGEVKREELR